MKTYVNSGDVVVVTAAAAVASGGGVLIGSLFGVAQSAAAIGAEVAIVTRGVVTITKADEQAWTVGAKIYWDDASGEATTVSGTTGSDFPLIGVAVDAVAATAGLITGNVLLSGAFTV